jgi:hypothetical protein
MLIFKFLTFKTSLEGQNKRSVGLNPKFRLSYIDRDRD